MQNLIKTAAAWAVISVAVTSGAAPLTSQVSTRSAAAPVVNVPVAKAVAAAAAVAALKPATPAVIKLANAPAAKPTSVSDKALRAQMKFETARWGGKPVQTLDEQSRILLAQAAAEKVGLQEVGLSFHDVYGVIEAETSWIPRTGASKDGTANLGLAQFEPRTARGLGVTDPSDPVQAVIGAAKYMKEGAKWASRKVAALKLPPEQHAAKVREGVSVYYNLSIKGRNKWDGLNTATLPVETQRHIRNARAGAAEAAQLARLLKT
jgi:hypothetical protein